MNSSILHLLHRVHQRAGGLFHTHMAELNLTTTQYAVLVAAAERDGLSQQAIIDITGIDRSTVSQVVGLLVRKGLLKRRRGRRDARTYAVSLTDLGHDVLARSEPLIGQIEQQIIEALPAARAKTFLTNLQAIVAALQVAKA